MLMAMVSYNDGPNKLSKVGPFHHGLEKSRHLS